MGSTGVSATGGGPTGPEGRLGVVTPEGVFLAFEPAGLASRTLSKSLDLLVQFGILMTVFTVMGVAATNLPSTDTVMVVLAIILIALVVLVYPVILERFNRGRTVGQMAVGLRVVRVDGGPVNLGGSVARAALLLVDLFISFGGVGGLAIALTRRHQRLGDMVAGTMVIREKTGTIHQSPVPAVIPPQFASLAESLPLERIDASDLALAREVMGRSLASPAGLPVLVDRAADLVDSKMGGVRPRRMLRSTFLTVVLGAAAGSPQRVGRSGPVGGSRSDPSEGPDRKVGEMEEFPTATLGDTPDPGGFEATEVPPSAGESPF